MPKFVVESIADNLVTLRVPGANYQNSFALRGKEGATLGVDERVRGTIHAPAFKIDRVAMGGNFVEPLYGRPRRMQGTILAVNAATNELIVQVGYEVTVKLPERYRAETFQAGERVGWENVEMPVFAIAVASTTAA